MVLITHDTDIAQFAQRIVAFRDGKIISDHPVENRQRAAGGSFADDGSAPAAAAEADAAPAIAGGTA